LAVHVTSSTPRSQISFISASREVADQQWAVIAPVTHCGFTRATEDTTVGERSMGDARLNYQELVFGFFDRFLKGEKSSVLDAQPKVTYFTMPSRSHGRGSAGA
jgi:uncharacterized protein